MVVVGSRVVDCSSALEHFFCWFPFFGFHFFQLFLLSLGYTLAGDALRFLIIGGYGEIKEQRGQKKGGGGIFEFLPSGLHWP